jgi:hypothetical protein
VGSIDTNATTTKYIKCNLMSQAYLMVRTSFAYIMVFHQSEKTRGASSRQ